MVIEETVKTSINLNTYMVFEVDNRQKLVVVIEETITTSINLNAYMVFEVDNRQKNSYKKRAGYVPAFLF